MSSSQVNYPEKIILKGKGVNLSRNLKKGPQREKILLDSYTVQLKRNEQAFQLVLSAGLSGKIDSLSIKIPLTEKWMPLIHHSYHRAYTSLFLNNSSRSTVLQICQNPKTPGLVRINLAKDGRSVMLSWVIDRNMEAMEEMTLPVIIFSQNEEKIIPRRYTFKEKIQPSLNRGRLLTFPGSPDVQRVSHDIAALSRSGISFDFYLLDYGFVPLWGDWGNLPPGILEKLPSITSEIRKKNMLPGICLAPLAAESRSISAQSGFTLNRGPRRTIKTRGKTKRIFPLDITKEEVRNNLRMTLDLYIKGGFKFFHFDHLDLLLEEGSWQDESRGPLDRFRLLTRIMEPYQERGIIFSASHLPLIEGMEHFNMVTPFAMDRHGRLSQEDWHRLSLLIETALTVKNPPLLSLGGGSFGTEKNQINCRHTKICQNSQTLLNGPAILSDKYEDWDESMLEMWNELAVDKKMPLLPLEYSPLGFSQNVLLLINKRKNVAIYNLTGRKKVIRLLEGELGDNRGLSPSQSTALKSRELILPMGSESSHIFQV